MQSSIIKYLLTAGNILLVTAAVYLGVNGFYNIMTARVDVGVPPSPISQTVVAEEQDIHQPLAYYRVITERNLFHTKSEADKTSKKETIQLDNLKQTELKLKLWGTVTGSEDRAYAVIEDQTAREQNLYKIGDEVQSARVKAIFRNKVILSVRGRNEILEMEDITQTASLRPSVTRRPRTSHNRPTPRRRITLRREQIDSAMGDINELMGQINIRPHIEDGVPEGMMLSNIKPNSLFRRMGLRNGDILTGVDGRPIQAIDDAIKLYEDLKSSNGAKLEIKRKGRPTIIEYTIR
jgi:general secretion pathway protein C